MIFIDLLSAKGVLLISLYYISNIDFDQNFKSKSEMNETFLQLTVPQIKAEMEKILQWLVPIAANTTKYIC